VTAKVRTVLKTLYQCQLAKCCILTSCSRTCVRGRADGSSSVDACIQWTQTDIR